MTKWRPWRHFAHCMFETPCPALEPLLLRFHVRACGTMHFRYPHDSLHGGFGNMLKPWPEIYDCLYGEKDGSAPHPYVLRPLPSMLEPLRDGSRFGFDLILIGPAARHALVCCEALHRLGAEGMPPRHYRYRIEKVETLAPGGGATVWSPVGGWNPEAARPLALSGLLLPPASGARFVLHTRLQIKKQAGNDDSDPVQEIPAIGTLINSMAKRLNALASLPDPQAAPPLSGETVNRLHQLCRGLPPPQGWASFHECTERDGKRRMELSGLSGWFHYPDLPAEVGRLLSLAEWFHLGAKASFGLGWAGWDEVVRNDNGKYPAPAGAMPKNRK